MTTFEKPDTLFQLWSGGVSVLIDATQQQLPSIVYWGADVGELSAEDAANLAQANVVPQASNAPTVPVRLSILPEHFTGWTGRPGLSGSRRGSAWSPTFRVDRVELVDRALTFFARDETAQLALRIEIELTVSGLLRARAAVTNEGDSYQLDELSLAFPLPARAREILDFGGRWGLERVPQRSELTVGTHLREGRKGRTGADAATVLTVGTPGFGFAEGDVWGVHVGFSGNHRHYAERQSTGFQVIGGGELLLPGEVRLETGDEYLGPWVYAAYGRGLDDQAGRFHEYLRARPSHPSSARPVTLNVWEAVYFAHDLDHLVDLADRAAAIGVERYVLDDGWFRGRRNDKAGLGDWYVDEGVWPKGLHPLVDHVRGLGMQFGLWFEPEMVNPDSDLARAHPDWLMQTDGRLPIASRQQQVLNLGLPDAYAYILERISAILDEYDIAYIKWDHNRDLIDAGWAGDGRPAIHEQTLAVYRIMDELRRRYPGLEIESCSSGGSRVDLGIIERADRVWASDCNDPLDRQHINRWTGQLLPPEMLGEHIASGRSHSTGRTHELSFRAGTAIFGHLGIEWDISAASEPDLDQLRTWIAFYRSHRELTHTGTVVRMDMPDDSLWVYGVVSADRRRALFSLSFLTRSEVSPRGRFTLRGLDPQARYRVRPVFIGGLNRGFRAPKWFGERDASTSDTDGFAGTILTGRALALAGLQSPASYPEHVLLLEVAAVAG